MRILDLGRRPYADTEAAMRAFTRERTDDTADELWLVEHEPVFTQGIAGSEAHVHAAGDIPVWRTDRGGQVTFHGPGQVVAYPIMDLRHWKRDVGAYVRGIEQAIIDTLKEFGIQASRVPKLTGVWVGEGDAQAKIAAIGVHLSRWVSTHGLALNVTTDLRYFQYIVPCGLTKPVTSMERVLGGVRADAEAVKEALARHFGEIFDFEMQAEPVLTGEFA